MDPSVLGVGAGRTRVREIIESTQDGVSAAVPEVEAEQKHLAHRRRFGHPLSWQEKIMCTVDTHVSETLVNTAGVRMALGSRIQQQVENPDERSVSR